MLVLSCVQTQLRTLICPAGQQVLPGAMEEAALRELPPWMRAEASMSVSRSADSTGAGQVTAQQGAQQHASSTEQQDLHVGRPASLSGAQ